MATSRKRRSSGKNTKRQPEQAPYAWNEGIAIALGGLGLLLFLALISYAPADLPSWVPWSTGAGPGHVVGNFIGPVGALTAGTLYFFLGAACYLLPGVLVWWAIQVLMGYRVFKSRSFMSLALLLVSGACLVEFQDLMFSDWPARYNLPESAGGAIGYGIGGKIVGGLLGPVGASIVMTICYVVSLIIITGVHPVRFAILCRQRLGEYLEERREAAAAAMDGGRLTSAPKKAATGSRRTARRKTVSDDEEGDFVVAMDDGAAVEELELPLTQKLPAPKIIDASMPLQRDQSARDADSGALFGKSKNAGGKSGTGLVASSGNFENYELPTLKLLEPPKESDAKPADPNELLLVQNTIIETLETFGIEVSPGDITRGPTITRYEIYPGRGLRVNRITALEADIARATKAERINIIAPIPGKDTVGVEIANSKKVLVPLRELFEGPDFRKSRAKIPLALGKDVYGKTIIGDLAQMPHLLVAGATGSGKSVCINSIISSLLYRFTPDELRFIMIDPKVVEMQMYNTLPHLVVPVVTDPKKVLLALRWVINEMERRYAMFAKMSCRNFDGFNLRKRTDEKDKDKDKLAKNAVAAIEDPVAEEEALTTHAVNISNGGGNGDGNGSGHGNGEIVERVNARVTSPELDLDDCDQEEEIPDTLPYIVVIIDELADLMQTAPADVEVAIARIAQKARAAGIHLIVATQTPRADVVTGIIKANIPSRIAFQVASKIDSRVILDASGAERLVGKGDMLYMPPGSSQLVRAQGAFLSDEETQAVVDFCSNQAEPEFEPDIHNTLEGNGGDDDEDVSPEDEETLERCIEVIYQEKKASTSLLQRRLRLGYTRAARMMDIMEQRGIIGPGEGAKPREILVDLSQDFD